MRTHQNRDVTEAFGVTRVRARGFVLVQDTLCYGVIPIERDLSNRVVVYETRAEADVECLDAVEMTIDAEMDAGMYSETVDGGPWVEAATVFGDGSLSLPHLHRHFTAQALRRLIR